MHQPVIPGLPDDLALLCLAKVSHGYHGLLESVSKSWRDMIRSADYAHYRAKHGCCGDWLFVLTEQSNNQWVAFDPEADRWHPLPKVSGDCSVGQHFGFSCVCVYNRLLVIGGSYAPLDSVISGKVYVAGGRNLSCTKGLALAEVYDPLTDKWEELPPMPTPLMDCLGLSYRGKFHVLSDQVGLSETNITQVFNPSINTWCTMEDIWPFSRAMQFAVQVMCDGRVYTVVDWGESLIKTRDSEGGEWYTVGSVPSVILTTHTRALEAFSYGFASLRDELYILGGKVLKWEEAGAGRFDIVRLDLDVHPWKRKVVLDQVERDNAIVMANAITANIAWVSVFSRRRDGHSDIHGRHVWLAFEFSVPLEDGTGWISLMKNSSSVWLAFLL
ncbi:F-BOX/KELCH-REPEAT PROTEIN [Salix koriyanagi]|uniref:F-BOX/KELCH-REPEAT PROTEIN n=1 Tax=Salix koriyanagi TaxID=2511006 RepID=A0A9Q0WSI3_9ROSI|nr:F-BOX/KELCH-REPEAT PROTEIN [Salix koriyanagi]